MLNYFFLMGDALFISLFLLKKLCNNKSILKLLFVISTEVNLMNEVEKSKCYSLF